MICNNNKTESSTTPSITSISKSHRTKSATNKSTDDVRMINRGGGDCLANDILERKLNKGEAMLVLLCEKNSHPFETRFIPLLPNAQCTVGRISSKCRPSESNAFFDCKVLSRNQAMVWYDSVEHKFWLKDTQSSNGTFLNGSKLNDEAMQLHSGDLMQLGVNVYENKCSEVHNCIIAAVQLYLPRMLEQTTASKTIEQQHEHGHEHGSGDHIEVSAGEPQEQPTPPNSNAVEFDICETSRTTVVDCNNAVAVNGDKQPPPPSPLPSPSPSQPSDELSATSDAAVLRRPCLLFKDERSDEPIQVELCTIESFIEAIENNNLDAWDSIAKLDFYFQRIFMLQHKVNLLQKGITEDVLKSEKEQWAQEKQSYARTAKDTMRRVGLECMELTLHIEQVETNYKRAESECDSLRDLIDQRLQSMNDFLCLLHHIEIDYDEYKAEIQTKNCELIAELNGKLDNLMEKLEKLEKEREDLGKQLEEQEIKMANESIDDGEVEVVNSSEKLMQLVGKFQKLQQILKRLEEGGQQHIDEFKFKEIFGKLLLQCKELQLLQSYKFEDNNSTMTTDAFNSLPPQRDELCLKEVSKSEASEQTSCDFYADNFEAQLEDLQAQLMEQELGTEHLRDMLENECDMYRKELNHLEQENATLQRQKAAQQAAAAAAQVKVEERKRSEIDAAAELERKEKLSAALKEKQFILTHKDEELHDCKQRLNACEDETLQLQAQLNAELNQQQLLQQQQQQQSTNLLPIIVPIFLGLIGMCVYAVMTYSF